MDKGEEGCPGPTWGGKTVIYQRGRQIIRTRDAPIRHWPIIGQQIIGA